MVVTAKLKKRNILILLAVLAAILAVLFIPGRKTNETAGTSAAEKVETNEQRVAFLQNLGWEVEESPVETQEVTIPAEENEVYTRYNELQKSQGYNLNDFAGKTVKRYVYEIKNHPDAAGTYRATLLVHKGRVIGGDVASTDAGGQMHSLQMPT